MKKLLLTLTLIIMALTANAQAYQYNCELGGDDNVKLYTCTTEKIDNVSNLPLYLGLSCNYKITCILSLETFSFRKQYHKEKKNYSIQIKLSNGDVLSSFNCGCNMAYLWYENMRSFKVNNISKDKYGAYSMSLLRTYDIVSITIDDITINTPGLRSAATFDAMCKTLISKTGDQGQYGKRLTGGNQTTNQRTTTQRTPSKPATSTPSTNRTQQKTTNPSATSTTNKVQSSTSARTTTSTTKPATTPTTTKPNSTTTTPKAPGKSSKKKEHTERLREAFKNLPKRNNSQ